MKSFYEYLSDVKKEYKYKLKFAVQVDDAFMDSLERILMKYDVIEITNPKKSILQRNKIDFPNLGPIETWSIEIVSDRPIHVPSLITDISSELNVSENFMRIRSAHDPVAIDDRFSEELDEINKIAGDDKEATLLGNDEPEEDQKLLYGDEYNKKLLTYLAKNSANKQKAIEASGVPSAFSRLASLNVKSDDFNKDYDTPKPVSAYDITDTKNNETPAPTTPTGNIDSNTLTASKNFINDRDGKVRKIKRKGA